MDKRMFALNTILAIVDTVVAALAIIAFAWGSWNFDKWWMMLFTILPLILFNSHTVILNDIEEGESDES